MGLRELFLHLFIKTDDGKPATLLQRLLARIIDSVIVLFILFLLVVTQIFWFMNDLSDKYQYDPWGRSFVASLSFLGLYIIYEVVFHTYNRGQTPGKMVFNIHLSNAHLDSSSIKTAEARPRLFQSIFRAITGPAVLLLFFEPFPWQVSLICISMGITAVFSSQRKSIQDFMAGTRVVFLEPTPEDEEFIRQEKALRKERVEKYSLGIFRQNQKRDKNT